MLKKVSLPHAHGAVSEAATVQEDVRGGRRRWRRGARRKKVDVPLPVRPDGAE